MLFFMRNASLLSLVPSQFLRRCGIASVRAFLFWCFNTISHLQSCIVAPCHLSLKGMRNLRHTWNSYYNSRIHYLRTANTSVRSGSSSSGGCVLSTVLALLDATDVSVKPGSRTCQKQHCCFLTFRFQAMELSRKGSTGQVGDQPLVDLLFRKLREQLGGHHHIV